MAGHVAALLDQLGLDRVDVAGFSWGGALAQELALTQGARVRRLVLIATSPVLPVPGGGMTAWMDGDIMTSGLRLAGTSPFGLAAQLWSASGWSAIDRLPDLTDMPVLVLAGRHDQMVPASCGDWLARLIPEAQLHQIDGAHLFAFRQAEKVAPLIQAFLDYSMVH